MVGLIDGSLSTLAPIFSIALISHRPFYAFVAGLATSIGAGISMAFSEGLSDTGELTGRGNPIVRGGITGLGTFVGGILHSLPFLIPTYHARSSPRSSSSTLELIALAVLRARFFSTSFTTSLARRLARGRGDRRGERRARRDRLAGSGRLVGGRLGIAVPPLPARARRRVGSAVARSLRSGSPAGSARRPASSSRVRLRGSSAARPPRPAPVVDASAPSGLALDRRRLASPARRAVGGRLASVAPRQRRAS